LAKAFDVIKPISRRTGFPKLVLNKSDAKKYGRDICDVAAIVCC
jgi:hypothetical protein